MSDQVSQYSVTTDVIRHIRAVAAEQPDYVYQRVMFAMTAHSGNEGPVCIYVQRNADGTFSPSCLIGQGLWRAGLIDASLWENKLANGSDRAESLLKRLNIAVSPWQAKWLSWVQRGQDSGQSWGEAVAYADEKAENDGVPPQVRVKLAMAV